MNTLGLLLFLVGQGAFDDSYIPVYHSPKTVHQEIYRLLHTLWLKLLDSMLRTGRTIKSKCSSYQSIYSYAFGLLNEVSKSTLLYLCKIQIVTMQHRMKRCCVLMGQCFFLFWSNYMSFSFKSEFLHFTSFHMAPQFPW